MILRFHHKISLNQKFGKNVYQKKFISTSKLMMSFHEYERSGYPVKYDGPLEEKNLSLLGKMKQGYRELKKQTGLFVDECKEFMKLDPIRIWRTGEVDVMWRFTGNPESLNNWVITSDKDWNEGFSEVNLDLSSLGKGVFSGFVNQTVIKSGTISAAGYCNLKSVPKFKSFYREVKHQWSPYTHLVMRIRGDGRAYIIVLNCKGYYDMHWNDIYTYPLYTRGGPYWQIVKIPFSKFFLSSKGAVQDDQVRIDLTEISNFGITAAKFDGPFKLEIDWIGCEYDDSEWEEFAYEKYSMEGIMF